MPRHRQPPPQTWRTFLENHAKTMVSVDFFTVPTLTFQLLYCFFVIEHGRRRLLHFNVTRHPTADWVVQQLREAFPDSALYRYAILDHDSKFDADVMAFLKATGLQPKRTSLQAPWQNGIAERWVGSCRREILDQIIALNERHLRRLIRESCRLRLHELPALDLVVSARAQARAARNEALRASLNELWDTVKELSVQP